MHMSTRARWLLDEVKKAGAVSIETLEAMAEAKYSGSVTYTERQEIVATAADLHVAETRGDPVPPPRRPTTPKESSMDRKQLTSEETRAVAVEYFKGHPGASARECYEYIETLGTPSVSKSTFLNDTGSKVRRDLGLGKGKKTPRKSTPEKKEVGARTEGAIRSESAAGRPVRVEEPGPADGGRGRIVIDTPGVSLRASTDFQLALLLGALIASVEGAAPGTTMKALELARCMNAARPDLLHELPPEALNG